MTKRDRDQDEAFGQGRNQKGPITPPPRWLLLLTWGAFLIVVAVIATGCTAPGPLYSQDICGQRVVFHPDNLKPCNGGASACTVRTATDTGYQVYYSTLDDGVLAHEEEHVCGMRHREPWVVVGGAVCTVVTEGGNTAWKKGDVMCRMDSGPPVKVTDERMRFYVLTTK